MIVLSCYNAFKLIYMHINENTSKKREMWALFASGLCIDACTDVSAMFIL